jgi:3-phosphoglycerate kinase
MGRLTEAKFKGKSVFVRCDLNVPLDGHQRSTDDTRIRATIPTIQYLLRKDAKVHKDDDVIEPKLQKLVVTLPNRCLMNCVNLIQSCFSHSCICRWDAVSHRQSWPAPVKCVILGDGVQVRLLPGSPPV